VSNTPKIGARVWIVDDPRRGQPSMEPDVVADIGTRPTGEAWAMTERCGIFTRAPDSRWIRSHCPVSDATVDVPRYLTEVKTGESDAWIRCHGEGLYLASAPAGRINEVPAWQ
jgi:hypothetical protein